jgi:PAS domain S-box-containing protein
MMAPPVCILYSQDADLSRRVKAFARTLAEVRHVQDPDRLEVVLQQSGPALLLLDLRARESRELLEQVQKSWPNVLIIAFGTLRSEPLRDAEQAGIYAAEELQLDRRRFQAMLGRAFDHLRLLEENRDLREESSLALAPSPGHRPDPVSDGYGAPSAPMLRFPRVFRRFENVDALLASVVETVADAAGVTRLGIFAHNRQGERYRLRAGLHCLPETQEIDFAERDPLVRWFELHAHLVSRANLPQVADRAQRSILRRALDTFGAEVIVPLYARSRIIGWLFFGHRLTGLAFQHRELEGLMTLAEHVSTVLENALLNEEVTLQKTLAETLLKSIPPGIVATDEEGTIRWFNPTAGEMLGVRSEEVLHKNVEALGAPLASYLRETLDSRTALAPRRWVDGDTRRLLSVESRRLSSGQSYLGAVVVINDLTAEQDLQEKQDLVDRAAFWTDLAASMSHEIRNPLVAIKTFAQLLPERFEDEDFRKDFNRIVVKEIDRLDAIISQINSFAHPPEVALKSIDVRAPLKKGLDAARDRFDRDGDVTVETSLPADLPNVLGDEAALAEAFAHLVANAAEATSAQEKPHITLSAKAIREGNHTSGVLVTVRDNGVGIDPELKNKIFSPFCTTKPRGMGLGLPIVKRTIFDHHGRVDIDSGANGTLVSVTLPVSSNGH